MLWSNTCDKQPILFIHALCRNSEMSTMTLTPISLEKLVLGQKCF